MGTLEGNKEGVDDRRQNQNPQRGATMMVVFRPGGDAGKCKLECTDLTQSKRLCGKYAVRVRVLRISWYISISAFMCADVAYV